MNRKTIDLKLEKVSLSPSKTRRGTIYHQQNVLKESGRFSSNNSAKEEKLIENRQKNQAEIEQATKYLKKDGMMWWILYGQRKYKP